MPISSRLDASVLAAMRVRREIREKDAPAKLALLRRLAHPELSRLTETRVEQSFNEQLFARVFGYRTLFSTDETQFHLLPKNLAGRGRYDDFSLGWFGDGEDRVVGSAELKSADVDLDATKGGRSPVTQALSAAAALTGCRWCIVSNFREIRLYALADATAPIVRARLDEIVGRDELAALCSHFDRPALLGSVGSENPEMSMALDLQHPSAPVASASDAFRVVCRFTPSNERTFPLHDVEHAVRQVIEAPAARRLFPGGPRESITLRDGWIAADAAVAKIRSRLALNRHGEMQLSVAILRYPSRTVQGANGTTVVHPVHLGELAQVFRAFAPMVRTAIQLVTGPNQVGFVGELSAELREMDGAEIDAGDWVRARRVSSGISEQSDLLAGPLDWDPLGAAKLTAASLATALCELAIYFRSSSGGVLLDPQIVQTAAFADLPG